MTNAATVRRNLDAAITMRSAETELQNAIEVRATASEIVAPQPDLSKMHFVRDFLQTSHFTLRSLRPTLPTALNLRAIKKH